MEVYFQTGALPDNVRALKYYVWASDINPLRNWAGRSAKSVSLDQCSKVVFIRC